MYHTLHNILSDKTGNEIFTLFSFWHFFYIALAIAAITVTLITLRKKSAQSKKKAPYIFINIAFGLYIADLFLMPLAYGHIEIEKLPFHACTAMCVACFLSYRVKFLENIRTSLVLIAFISNIAYLLYPAGVMWYEIHPLSYRVVQTLMFHSVMTVFCILYLIYEREKISIKNCHIDLLVTAILTVWALLGSYTYSGSEGGYDHLFNWFFVIRDPFNAIPESVAPFIAPFINVILFFAGEFCIRLIISCISRSLCKKRDH